jgi:putative peptidoglycan lipid II flippase
VAAFFMDNPAYFAWGFTVGYLIFGAWALRRVWRTGLLALPATCEWPRFSEVLRAFWETLRPLLLLPVILQGNIALERVIASLIGLIVVSALDYARFLTDTLIFLVSMPVALAGLVSWSGLDEAEMRERLKRVLVLMLLIAVPTSVFLSVHSHRVVAALYGRGAFDAQSVQATGDILFGISLGLWAQVVGYVLIKALNAQLRNRSVLWVMASALAANAITNIALYGRLGAMTLGLGNTVYGLVLLVGALSALGLWRELASSSMMIVLGSAGYLLANFFLPLSENVWSSLVLAGTFALAYWSVWVGVVPSLRHAVLNAIGSRQEQPL